MGFLSSLRLGAGLATQDLGNFIGLPEMGWSEKIAGRSTPSNVGKTYASEPAPFDYSQAKSVPIQSPYRPPSPTGTLSSGGQTSTPTQQDPLAGAAGATQSEADAYLQSLNTEYDRAAEDLRAQLGQAGTAREQGLSSLQGAVDQYGNLIGQQKTSASQSTAKNIQSAGSTAAQTQAKSRNIVPQATS